MTSSTHLRRPLLPHRGLWPSWGQLLSLSRQCLRHTSREVPPRGELPNVLPLRVRCRARQREAYGRTGAQNLRMAEVAVVEEGILRLPQAKPEIWEVGPAWGWLKVWEGRR